MHLTVYKKILENLLFIDIETVACTKNYDSLDKKLQHLWCKKTETIKTALQEDVASLFAQKAGIYAEFGKIIVIGLGFLKFDEQDNLILRVKSLCNHDEKKLLQQFKELLATRFQQNYVQLCAHNGKEFDFPYLCRRMIVQGIALPSILDISGKKPWEITHVDTMEMWKFGDWKNFTSLDLLATLFGIQSSKQLMEGHEVHHYYYIKNALDKIAAYCVEDVIVLVQIFLKMRYLTSIPQKNIQLI